MFHNTPELIPQEEFFAQMDRFAAALSSSQYKPQDAIHVWLGCGKKV